MKQVGMIKEITNLYVIIDIQGKELKIRDLYTDNVKRFRNEDLVEFETEERESKEDPNIKYLWFVSINHAESPKPADAFQPQTTRKSTLPGVEVVEANIVETDKKEPVKTQTITTIEIPTRDVIMARESALKSAVAYNTGKNVPSAGVVKDAKIFEEYILGIK
jgi:hypothetical protein